MRRGLGATRPVPRPARCMRTAARCDTSQLDAGCECFTRVGPNRELARSAQVAIATVWDGGQGYACAIPLWCQSATDLARVIMADVLLLAPTPSEDCPHAVHLFPNRTFAAAQSYLKRHARRLGSRSGGGSAFALANLLKVALFSFERLYELVLYADLDIDLMARPLDAVTWQASSSALLASRALFVSLCDHASPVNGGLFLVRPRMRIFQQGLDVLERGTWTAKEGFDGVGSPQSWSAADRTRVRRLVERLAAGSGASLFKVEGTINSTQFWKFDSWDFVNGALDQGLFWYLFYLKNPVGTWSNYVSPKHGQPPGLVKWQVDHFWGYGKPWRQAAAFSYWRRLKQPGAARGRRTSCGTLAEKGAKGPNTFRGSSQRVVGPLPWPDGMRAFASPGQRSWVVQHRNDCFRSDPKTCPAKQASFSI